MTIVVFPGFWLCFLPECSCACWVGWHLNSVGEQEGGGGGGGVKRVWRGGGCEARRGRVW